VTVDIFGGNFHSYGRHKKRYPKRMNYLLKNGWTSIIIWTTYGFDALECFWFIDSLISVRKKGLHSILGNGKPAPKK
jgi:hypothetical protein